MPEAAVHVGRGPRDTLCTEAASVFDSEYFRTILDADVEATDPNAVVEVHLVNGHTLRVSSVLSVHSEYVTLEVYRAPRVDGGQPLRWQGPPPVEQAGRAAKDSPAAAKEAEKAGDGVPRTNSSEMLRAVVSYAGIVSVTVAPPRAEAGSRVGFGS